MRNLEKLLQMIKAIVKDLAKTTNPDIPKKWNCCDELVRPIDLERHILENHFGEYQFSYEDKRELILIISILSSLLVLSFTQGK